MAKNTDPIVKSPEADLFRKGAVLRPLWGFVEDQEGAAVYDPTPRFYRVQAVNRSADALMLNTLRREADGTEAIIERATGENFKISTFLRLYFRGKLAISAKNGPKCKIKCEIICRNQKGAYICNQKAITPPQRNKITKQWLT